MRVYVPVTGGDLSRLEEQGRLVDDGSRTVLAVTPWACTELGVEDPEDEEAEYVVLLAAAEQQQQGGASPAAVLVFDVPGAEPPHEELRVALGRDLPRRRLVAVHPLPGLEWYAGHELPDVLSALS